MIFWAGFSGWNLLLLKMRWKVNVQLLFKSILKGKFGLPCCLWAFAIWNKYKQEVTKEASWIKHLWPLCFNFSNKSVIINASTITQCQMKCVFTQVTDKCGVLRHFEHFTSWGTRKTYSDFTLTLFYCI